MSAAVANGITANPATALSTVIDHSRILHPPNSKEHIRREVLSGKRETPCNTHRVVGCVFQDTCGTGFGYCPPDHGPVGIEYARTMKNGILREDEGYDLLVNGTGRTFSDTKDVPTKSRGN